MKRCLEAVVDMTEKKILTPSAGGVFSINEIGEAHAFLEGRTSTGKIAIMWK
jgi:hypothetical protein